MSAGSHGSWFKLGASSCFNDSHDMTFMFMIGCGTRTKRIKIMVCLGHSRVWKKERLQTFQCHHRVCMSFAGFSMNRMNEPYAK